MSSRDNKKLSVIVVGGGVVGASIAWHLASQDVALTVIAADLGGEATPCSFAWLNANFHNPRHYYDLRRRSMARWKELASEVPGLSHLIQWPGSLQWDMSPDELAEYEKQHTSWGYDIGRVVKEEIATREPSLSNDVLPAWGLRLGEEGAVEAADAALLMLKDAQARGARVISTAVTKLIKNETGVQGVVTASGDQLSADHVVLAAGVGSVQLCESVGVALPVTGKAGLLVHSKPIEERLLNGLIISNGPHMRQTASGRLLAGAGFAGSNPGDDSQATAEGLFEKVKKMFKADAAGVDKLELDFFTIGYRPTPQDGLPILGASGLDRLTLAVMHSGVTLAAIVGKALTDDLVYGKKDPALDAFSIERFK